MPLTIESDIHLCASDPYQIFQYDNNEGTDWKLSKDFDDICDRIFDLKGKTNSLPFDNIKAKIYID